MNIKGREIKHGDSQRRKITKEYRAWVNIKTRCLNHNNEHFRWYGGRFITMYPEWVLSYEAFLN